MSASDRDDEMSAGTLPAAASPPPRPEGRPRILIVDDEEGVLDLCRRTLGRTYEVITADSAQSGKEKLRAGEFAVIIADQTMPGGDGMELLTECHSAYPHVGRILMTANASQEMAIAAINTGRVSSYIIKPWKNDEFRRIVDREVQIAQLRRRAEEEYKRYRSIVYDERFDMPTRHVLEGPAMRLVQEHGFLGVLLIDASELWATQAEFGKEAFGRIEREFVEILKSMRGKLYREEDSLAVDEVESSSFVIFLAHPREERVACARDVEAIAERLQEFITQRVVKMNLPVLSGYPGIAVGHGFVLHNPHLPTRFQVRKAVGDARDNARRRLEADDKVSRKSYLERIIVRREITTVFQSIIDLQARAIMGYEALSRGPAGTEYESPEFLLRIADRTELTFELDRVFRSAALTSAASLPRDTLVFVNTLPVTLYDPDLGTERLTRFLERINLDPARLVFEFSERYVVRNIDVLQDALDRHRAIGIKLAIDDVGAGYSGLERIASLNPDYLKIDRSLINQIQDFPVKRSVLSALVTMGREIGASMIAEGIETEGELRCILDLGVPLAQGYFFDRPVPVDAVKNHSVTFD